MAWMSIVSSLARLWERLYETNGMWRVAAGIIAPIGARPFKTFQIKLNKNDAIF